MLTSAVRLLFGRTPLRPLATLGIGVPAAQAALEETAPGPPVHISWPAARLALTSQLWGPGFIIPGGEIETMRLTRSFGASAATSMLIVGVGSGGPASTIARNVGAWVTGMDNDPSLLAAARGFISRAKLTKKVSIKAWDPANPDFAVNSYHHCLALEPLHGARPEPILHGLAQALRPGGQMVITALAAPAPLDANDRAVRRWGDLEHRDPADVHAPIAITRMLSRIGLDVRIAEDISDRHMEHAMLGWRVLMRDLRDRKPDRQEAAQLVTEAELWLMRRRLIRDGRLRMMRWHAISRAPVV